jgi:hypothetical protein
MMAAVGMAANVAGGVVGAVGSEYGAKATASQQNYQAAIADMNAKVAEQDAAYAEAAGETRAQEIGMRGRAQFETTRAGFGASNVSGKSQSNVLKSETAITQFEEASTRADAAKQAYGYRVKAASDTAQAGAYRAGAGTALVAGDIGAVSSILGGVAGVSSKWTQGQQTGMFAPSYGPQPYDPGSPGGLY